LKSRLSRGDGIKANVVNDSRKGAAESEGVKRLVIAQTVS
jgi:hypothetical protein